MGTDGAEVDHAAPAALEGYAYTSAYVASKHGLLGLTRALQAEAVARWREADLTVNAVCPGFVDAGMFSEWGRKPPALAGLVTSEAVARATLRAVRANLAEVYAVVGELDLAIDEVEYLLSVPSYMTLEILRHDPAWKVVREHPRYAEVVSKFENAGSS